MKTNHEIQLKNLPDSFFIKELQWYSKEELQGLLEKQAKKKEDYTIKLTYANSIDDMQQIKAHATKWQIKQALKYRLDFDQRHGKIEIEGKDF